MDFNVKEKKVTLGITKNIQSEANIYCMAKKAFPQKEMVSCKELTEEMCRINWYDVLLYLTMMTEGTYHGYADDSQYRWVKPLFDVSWRELQQTNS